MVNYGITIDLDRCIGCNACVITCKVENATPEGIFFNKVLVGESGEYPNPQRNFVPVQCNHCQDAPCEEACPTGATQIEDDGRVTIDYDLCTGCKSCIEACPYDMREYLDKEKMQGSYFFGESNVFEEKKRENAEWSEGGVVVKCDMCPERTELGLEPACVSVCMTNARQFGDLDDPDSVVNELINEKGGEQPLADWETETSVFYLKSPAK